jgi:isopenicillin N synthase-like dioxygenase
MVIYTPPSVAKDIPVIDLAESFSHDIEKRKAVAWEIHKAARQTGFFYIKNHGVPVELQKAYFDLAKEYFASPMDENEDQFQELCLPAWVRTYYCSNSG